MRSWRLVLPILGLVGVFGMACSQPADEDASSGSGDALSEGSLSELEANDPTLKALHAAAKDIDKYEIDVSSIAVPTADASQGVQLENGYRTMGLDWFQTPNASYPDNKRWEQGSDTGKKCQWAAIFRFQEIFSHPPAEAEKARTTTQWHGSFWSWTDDYAAADGTGEPTASYAWSTSLWKWIGASGAGGKCQIPTRAMVVEMMKDCLRTAADNGGDPKGCAMPAYSEMVSTTSDAGTDASEADGGAP